MVSKKTSASSYAEGEFVYDGQYFLALARCLPPFLDQNRLDFCQNSFIHHVSTFFAEQDFNEFERKLHGRSRGFAGDDMAIHNHSVFLIRDALQVVLNRRMAGDAAILQNSRILQH